MPLPTLIDRPATKVGCKIGVDGSKAEGPFLRRRGVSETVASSCPLISLGLSLRPLCVRVGLV